MIYVSPMDLKLQLHAPSCYRGKNKIQCDREIFCHVMAFAIGLARDRYSEQTLMNDQAWMWE